jgi:hypothetical protein
MPWEEQETGGVILVDWGELKENHDKDNAIVVKENESIEGTITKIGSSEKYTHTYRLQVDGYEDDVMLLGNASLNRQMLGVNTKDEYNAKEGFVPVKEGDYVRVTFTGMYKSGKGKPAYGVKVEVKR